MQEGAAAPRGGIGGGGGGAPPLPEPRAAGLSGPARHDADMGTLFVTGTEIGVGKSVVAGALACAAVKAGTKLAFYKPFVTDDGEDLHSVMSAATSVMKRPASGFVHTPVYCASEYNYNSQASPYMGEFRKGGADVGAVLDRILDMCSASEAVMVEGSGSVMTPIRRNYFMVDLAADAAMAPIVVTTNRIGSLSLAVMSAAAFKERGAPPVGFVVNCIDPGGYAPDQLAGDIRGVTGAPVLAVLGMHGARPAQGRKGSLFGSFGPKVGADGTFDAGVDGVRLPEGVKRSAAAAKAVYEEGRLEAVAGVLFGREDSGAQGLRERAAEMRRGGRHAAAGRRSRRDGARRGRRAP